MSEFWMQAIGIALTMGLTLGLTAILNRSAARTETRIDANRNVLRINQLYAWLGGGLLSDHSCFHHR